MFLSETDDLWSKAGQACLDNVPLPGYDATSDECIRKKVIRKAICGIQVERGCGTHESCQQSSESIPRFILQEK